MNNKLITEEFLPTISGRNRWRQTYECSVCHDKFTVWKRKNVAVKPCEICSRRINAYLKFILKSELKHGKKFSYKLITKSNYSQEPLPIICKQHGTFYQKASYHIGKTTGKLCCPTCVEDFNRIKNKRSIESWKEELAGKLPNITIIKHGNCDSNLEPITLNCTYHGEFTSRLCTIKTSVQFCPQCVQDANSWSGRTTRTDIPGILYLIYIPSIAHWKLGVTSTSVTKRYQPTTLTYEEVWKLHFPTLKEAYKAEALTFRKFNKFRRNRNLPKLIECGGYTELLTCDIPITGIRTSNCTSKES